MLMSYDAVISYKTNTGFVFHFETLTFILIAVLLCLSHVSRAALKSLSIKELTERERRVCMCVNV